MKKIYIIGPIGSGKTTFSKELSKKYKIKSYELDKVIWDDENGNIKRTEEEIIKLFDEILSKKSWIIEDVGRNKFQKGKEEADIIYYIKLPRIKAYFRVVKRWLKQRIGIEKYNCPPTFKYLMTYISDAKNYYKKEKIKIKELESHKNKVVFINNKKMKEIIK